MNRPLGRSISVPFSSFDSCPFAVDIVAFIEVEFTVIFSKGQVSAAKAERSEVFVNCKPASFRYRRQEALRISRDMCS